MAINKRGDSYILDWWAAGKRYRKFFDTKKEAEAYQTGIRKKKLDGAYVAPDRVPLFRDAAAAWLATRADRTEASYDQYSGRVNRHLLHRFGNLRLNQISTEAIAAWRAELTRTRATARWHRPLAPKTITALLSTLSSIFNSAVSGGQLTSNPMDRLEPVYNRAREGKREDGAVTPDEILNADEIRRLIAVAEPGLYRTLFTLAAATGAREGELFALRWSDVTFDGQPHIAIRRSLSWAKGPGGGKDVPRFGPPKTKSGVRNISIDANVVLALKAWRLRAGRNELDLVFTEPDGSPIRRANMRTRGLTPALKKANLRHVKFHSLRHSHASGLIKNGAPITEVQHRLGHSNPSITLGTYSHWFKDADSGAASAYSASLFAIDTK